LASISAEKSGFSPFGFPAFPGVLNVRACNTDGKSNAAEKAYLNHTSS
jgi:hypothetical protein